MVFDGVIRDFPKLQSPFVRDEIDGKYVVTPTIPEDMQWVFEGSHEDVVCTEKLDGTDVSIIIEGGKITRVFNRTSEVPFFNKGKSYIIQAILEAYDRGYCNFTDGQYFGEVIGPKLNANPYKLDFHVWIPFNSYCRDHLSYHSFHKYPKTFEGLSRWFAMPVEEGGLFSLYYQKIHKAKVKPEGVVFHNLKTGQMAKLRMDMWDWHVGKKHKWHGEVE